MAKILVVDDSSFARSRMRAILEGAGHTVTEADSAVKALGLAPAIRPQLVTLDLLMPEVTGQELLQKLQPLLPAARFMIVTADVQEFTRQELLGLGAHAFLGKPYQPAEILAVVNQLLAPAVPAAPATDARLAQA